MCNNSMPDIAKKNAYIKFGENMSGSSQDIKGKQNLGLSQGP